MTLCHLRRTRTESAEQRMLYRGLVPRIQRGCDDNRKHARGVDTTDIGGSRTRS